jgi:hypothetical protein
MSGQLINKLILLFQREDYEYLQDGDIGTQSKYQSTVLRPPHADELALIGTIRGENSIAIRNSGFQNLGFSRDNEDERIPRVPPPLPSQNWIELQPNIIKTAQLPPADYEIHSYPIDDHYYAHPHPPPHSNILDFHQYREDYIHDDNELENFRFQPLRRPEIILPQAQRQETSTEFYGIHFSNTVPKSILKTGSSTTPSLELLSNSYSQAQHSLTSSKYDESLHTSVRTNTDRSIPIVPLSSRRRMQFASVNQLNDIEWEVSREFPNVVRDNQIFNSNRQRIPSIIVDPKIHIPWQREMNITESHSSWKGDIIEQQQAFEY